MIERKNRNRMNNIIHTISTFIILFHGRCESFAPNNIKSIIPTATMIRNTTSKLSSNDDNNNKNINDGIAGSFFNPVPPEDKSDKGNGENIPTAGADDDDDDSSTNNNNINMDEFDLSFAKLMKERTSKPLASNPSTIDGVPSSKVVGFGKKVSTTTRVIKTTTQKGEKKSPKPYVGIGKPLNDLQNPEYDDQGYTLYADEETGERKRVFEALVEYPCKFTLKIIGMNDGSFALDMVQLIADNCKVEMADIKYSEKNTGKYLSVTVHAPVESAEMLYALYENIDRDPRVKFKF